MSSPHPPPPPHYPSPPPGFHTYGSAGPQYPTGQTPPGTPMGGKAFQAVFVPAIAAPAVNPPSIQVTGPQVPAARPGKPKKEGESGEGADVTKGLLRKPGTGRSLLT